MKPIQYIPETRRDAQWGLSVCSVGYQKILPREIYPPTVHHREYLFNPCKGRILQEYQLLYIISGKGRLRTDHGGMREICAGDMFLLFPGEWHTYCPDETMGWEEYWIGFKGTNIDQRVRAGFFSVENPVYHIGLNGDVVKLYDEAIQIASCQEAFFQQLLAGLVNHLLGLMFMTNQTLTLNVAPELPGVIANARDYMQQKVEENISMPDVATYVGMSYAHFRHTFKRYTGLSPIQYFINLRLHRAKELLRGTDLSIKEISYNLHFVNPEYFSTLFKKRTGIKPSDFRGQR